MLRPRLAIVAPLVSLACRAPQSAPVVTRPPAVAAAAPPVAAPSVTAPVANTSAACPARSRALAEGEHVELVASGDGIREVGADGATLRALTATPAAFPRYTPDGRAVVFLARGRAEVRRLALDDCAEARVAALPRGVGAACGGGFAADYDPTEYVQSDDVVGLTADGAALCLHVMDRNLNMMNVEVVMRVGLADGAVAHRITQPATCGVAHPPVEAPPCVVAPRASSRRNGDATPFAIEGNRLVRRGPNGRRSTLGTVLGSDVSLDEMSPSGRWQVFSANVEEGDYIHRDLLLFDAQTGRMYPVVEGAFPAPLDARTLGAINTVHGHTVSATGETTIRFLDPGERLWVDGLLVIPGERGVTVSGALAR